MLICHAYLSIGSHQEFLLLISVIAIKSMQSVLKYYLGCDNTAYEKVVWMDKTINFHVYFQEHPIYKKKKSLYKIKGVEIVPSVA